MNTWITIFSEYKGLLNALCIDCIFKEDCANIDSDIYDYCYGMAYRKEEPNETTK